MQSINEQFSCNNNRSNWFLRISFRLIAGSMTLHLFRMQQIVSVFRTHFYSKFTKYTAGQIVKYKLNNKKKQNSYFKIIFTSQRGLLP